MMERRTLGRTGLEVGTIGLGTEYLTTDYVQGSLSETIDAVLGRAVEAGISYIDLLYIEPEYWEMMGPILRPYRDHLVLGAHWGGAVEYDMPMCVSTFDNILRHVGNGHVEVAMFTMVDTQAKWRWAVESAEFLQRYRQEGKVGAVGLATHAGPMAMQAVKSGLIDVIMYPVNLTSAAYPENQDLFRACREHGVGLVAMKPYGGGFMLQRHGDQEPITPAQCLHYTLSQPIATTVPGVRSLKQLEAVLHYLQATEEEKDYGRALIRAREFLQGQCTYCNHCLPCPSGIDVGRTIAIVDAVYTPKAELVPEYAALPAPASDCVECGVCMERCPFGVDVINKMHKAVEVFESVA
jgi:predicted aldo/keto reductase-like oxidoreductase